MMVRPRESFDQRLLEASLRITPEPRRAALAARRIRQRGRHREVCGPRARAAHREHDHGASTRRSAQTTIRVEPLRPPLFRSRTASDDMPDLLRSIERGHHDPERVIDEWARGFVRTKGATDTLDMLQRHDRRTSTPSSPTWRATKRAPKRPWRRWRQAARHLSRLRRADDRGRARLGLAARFVSGYLYDPDKHKPLIGGGNTHAWVRIFLPGSGWIEFDPTNGIVGNNGLIRVAVARDPYQAVPISGTWRGFPADNLGDEGERKTCTCRARQPPTQTDSRDAAKSCDATPDSAMLEQPAMQIRAGYEISLRCEQPTPLIGATERSPVARSHDLRTPDS